MTQTWDIRRATIEDLAALCAIDQRAEQDEQRRDLLRHAIASSGCYLAVAHGRVAGYGILTYHFFGNGFIDVLYVAPDARRQGIGAALMRHMARQCRTRKLFTSTNLSNLPMQQLLATLDYALSGVIHNLDEGDPELMYFKDTRSLGVSSRST